MEKDIYLRLLWEKKQALIWEEESKATSGRGLSYSRVVGEAVHDLTEDSILEPELQNFHERPILLGADVEALYPNMERTSTGGLVYQVAIESDMKFQGIE